MDGATGGAAQAVDSRSAELTTDFSVYVRDSQQRHKRLAYLLTGDLHAAEDLLQAAYAKTYPHWHKVCRYDVPDAYLRRVMVSIRTSWWRRSRNREHSVADVPEPSGSMGGSLGDPAGAVVESQALLGCLRQLPDRQRAAVVLRHWCDLSEADTAAIMGCSVGSVKSNTSKGLSRLRTAIGTAAADDEGGES